MIGFSRPFGSLVCCGGALGVAVAGTWAVGSVRAPLVAMPAVVVTALPPPPPPDSLASLLVSGPRNSRSSRGTTTLLLEAVGIIDWVPSSHERAELLGELIDMSDLDSSVVAALGRSSARIQSPGTRARLLRDLIANHPHATEAARRPVLDAIGSMQSTPERAMTLERFVTTRRLSPPALLEALQYIERLRADNERSRVLVAAARAQRIDGRARAIYMRAATAIPSDRYRSRAVAALTHRVAERRGGRE